MAEMHIVGQLLGASGFEDTNLFCKVRNRAGTVIFTLPTSTLLDRVDAQPPSHAPCNRHMHASTVGHHRRADVGAARGPVRGADTSGHAQRLRHGGLGAPARHPLRMQGADRLAQAALSSMEPRPARQERHMWVRLHARPYHTQQGPVPLLILHTLAL
jgi:hypothetical protein